METPDNIPPTSTEETVETNLQEPEQPETTEEVHQETKEEDFSLGTKEEVQIRHGDDPVVCEYRPSIMKSDMPNLLDVSLL